VNSIGGVARSAGEPEKTEKRGGELVWPNKTKADLTTDPRRRELPWNRVEESGLGGGPAGRSPETMRGLEKKKSRNHPRGTNRPQGWEIDEVNRSPSPCMRGESMSVDRQVRTQRCESWGQYGDQYRDKVVKGKRRAPV